MKITRKQRKQGKFRNHCEIFVIVAKMGKFKFSLHSEISLCSENCSPTTDKQTRTVKKNVVVFFYFILLLLLYYIYIYNFVFLYIFLFLLFF